MYSINGAGIASLAKRRKKMLFKKYIGKVGPENLLQGATLFQQASIIVLDFKLNVQRTNTNGFVDFFTGKLAQEIKMLKMKS